MWLQVWQKCGNATESLRQIGLVFSRQGKELRAAAVLTSRIATSKRLGLDPFAYLRDIFERISSHPVSRIGELLPDQWMAARL